MIHMGHLTLGDIFGEQGLFDSYEPNLACASFHAKEPVELRCITHEVVRRASSVRPSVYSELASHINHRLATTTAKLSQLLFSDLETRCYESLLEVSKLPEAMTHPEGTQITLSRIELAHMANCSRESAGRVVKELSEKGLITVSGQKIVLVGIRHGAPSQNFTPFPVEELQCASRLARASRA